MSRRSFLFAVGMVVCLICGVIGMLIALVRYEPQWYTTAGIAPGAERAHLSNEFKEAGSDLWALINNEREWGGKFTAQQINSFFEEGLYEMKLDADLQRGKISEPRIAFEQDHLRLGFRYGKGIWSSIVTLSLKVWVPQEDSSAMVLELENFQAGALPVSAQSVLEEMSRLLREKDIEINWYRQGGHPVAVLRFQTNQQRSNIQLTAIQVKEGMVMIQGRTNDSALDPSVPVSAPVPAGNE